MYVIIRDKIRQQVKSGVIVLILLLLMTLTGVKLLAWMEEIGFLSNSMYEDRPSGNYMRVEETEED